LIGGFQLKEIFNQDISFPKNITEFRFEESQSTENFEMILQVFPLLKSVNLFLDSVK